MLEVSPIGLASALGGAVQAAAAFRAGLARPTPGAPLGVFPPGADEPEPIIVHAVPSAGELQGVDRLAALLAEALADLTAQMRLDAIGSGMGIYLALPDPEARGFRIASESAERAKSETADDRRTRLARHLIQRASSDAQIDLRALPLRAKGGDQAAFSAVLAEASQAVETRALRAALLIAVDSLVSAETLELLLERNRLKTDDNPVGFMAGEAAVAMILNRTGSGSTAGAAVATVGAVDLRREPNPLGADRPSDGRAMAEGLRTAHGPASSSQPVPFLIVDNDGETHRAHELGMALWHLTKAKSPLTKSALSYPAKGFGNTGAAYGALATCLTSRAFARGYAPAPSAIVLAAADDGERAAFQLNAPGKAPAKPRV